MTDLLEWMPIESAPRDGSGVMLAIAGGHYGSPLMGAGRWTVEGPMVCWQGVSAHSVNLRNATHWMPLPKPPAV